MTGPTSKLASAFETPILVIEWPETELLNDALEHAIFKRRIEDPEGLNRSNANGTWHSDDHLLKWTKKAGEDLADMYKQGFAGFGEQFAIKPGGVYELSLQAWAMVTSDRGWSTVHTHPNAHFSAVYYPRSLPEAPEEHTVTGVKVQGGTLEFTDPRGPGNMTVPGLRLQPAFRLKPRAGNMVVFPSWLPHFVHPYQGDEDRVSIAANATIKKYTSPKE